MILDLFHLKDKIAIVTGCNRGIGFALAMALAEAGAHIIGISQKPAVKLKHEVQTLGRNYYQYLADFTARESLYKAIEAIKANHQNIDILINNAGTIIREPAISHADAQWDEVIAVNQNSQFILSREIGRLMAEQGYGKIIFVTSLLSFQGGLNVPSYAASKGAVQQLTKALANEWAKSNIQVNAIAPGYIITDNTKALRDDPVRNKDIISRIPTHRWGQPEDLKGAVVFLASSASSYINGTTLVVDGGWLAR